MLATQLRYDLLRFWREIFYVVFTIILPPVSYLFLGQLFGDATYSGGLSYAATYTPSFILLIAFGVIFFAFGFEQVTHRTTGVEKRITLTPVPKRTLLLAAILKSIILTSMGFFLVFSMGVLLYSLPFEPVNFLASYAFFILLNAVLLVMSSAIYSFFSNQNSALVFSIIVFQVVMISGGFAMPVELMPKFVQILAEANPVYHMNKIFIAIWNGQFVWTESSLRSMAVITLVFFVSLFILRKKQAK